MNDFSVMARLGVFCTQESLVFILLFFSICLNPEIFPLRLHTIVPRLPRKKANIKDAISRTCTKNLCNGGWVLKAHFGGEWGWNGHLWGSLSNARIPHHKAGRSEVFKFYLKSYSLSASGSAGAICMHHTIRCACSRGSSSNNLKAAGTINYNIAWPS